MERWKALRRVNFHGLEEPPTATEEPPPPSLPQSGEEVFEKKPHYPENMTAGDVGMWIRFRGRIASPSSAPPLLHKDSKGDYIDVQSHSYLMKILAKQGDLKVLFADKILKITGSGKIKRCIMVITDFAIYLMDPETDGLKRRIALAAIDKLCLSELSDNFFAIIIHKEYDCLMASTRKIEIAQVLVEAIKSATEDGLEVDFSNRFEYRAAANVMKEVCFEEIEGGIKTRIMTTERLSA